MVSLAKILKGAGYHTYMGGKWHLGHGENNIPGARGFEKSLSLLNGGASHFNDMAGLVEADEVEYTMNGKKIKDFGKLDVTKTAHFAFGEPMMVDGTGDGEHAAVNAFITGKLKDWHV